MIIEWTSGDKGREIETRVYQVVGVVRTYHTGSGGEQPAAVVTILEVPLEWGITDLTVARAVRELADRINRLINVVSAE